MNLQDETTEILQLVTDINNSINNPRVDNAMLMFIHICKQLNEDIIKKLKFNNVRDKYKKLLTDADFRAELDMFYKMMSSDDDARLLLDKKINYDEIYVLDKELYSKIHGLFIEMNEQLGVLKAELRQKETESEY